TRISISISTQAEEAVSELLESLFQQLPSIYTDAETRETMATTYLQKPTALTNNSVARIKKGLEQIRNCGIDCGSGKISVKKIRRQDWAESWKRHFKPIQIGKTLLIKPSWSKKIPRKNQALVVLDPGLSFGTGQHATTLFCLRQIVNCRRALVTQSFLDIGTGSGILAIAAAKLGYSPVRAFDFDRDAVRISRENALQNKVEKKVRPVHHDLTKLPLDSKTKYDLICANLIYDLLLVEKQRILNRLRPKGSLILAGILKSQFAKVKATYEKLGLKLIKTRIEKEWQSGLFSQKN
ncbi:MAG: 50S ribosomal protein L11 methyltransferase, partial [Limisphaerales bacterium]